MENQITEVRQLTAESKKIKINLGCGDHELPGYDNLDIKGTPRRKAYPLCETSGSFDEIRVSHLLEHFGMHKTADVLADWVSKLKPGGVLKIAVPDFKKIVQDFSDTDKDSSKRMTEPWLMGGQVDEYDYHKTIFTREKLMQQMQTAGLINVGGWSDDFKDSASLPVSLNLQGHKPFDSVDVTGIEDKEQNIIQEKDSLSKGGAASVEVKQEGKVIPFESPNVPSAEQIAEEKAKLDRLAENEPNIRIQAVMSMPRLAFTENAFTALNSFRGTGINVERATGAFWEQGLTRMMERFTNDGFDYLIAIDYDTYFTREQVVRLCQLAVENPDVDCIVSMQAKREEDVMLLGWNVPDGEDKATWLKQQILEKELIPIVTAHFGLTIIKCDALKTIGKPWFNSVPGPDGSWNEGRIDSDISFWHNMKRCGKKVMLAPRLQIGHLQQMVTYPGPIENGLHPEHHYINDIRAKGLPEHCKI